MTDPLSKAERDPDRLIKLYQPDGTSVMVTPGHLMRGGMTLEQVIEVERFGNTHYKPVAEAADRARAAGVSEERLQQVIDAHSKGRT